MISRILTGMTEKQWQLAFQQAQAHRPKGQFYYSDRPDKTCPTLEEFKQAVSDEARNRQFIAKALGRRLSYRAAIRLVIEEATRG